MERHYPAGLLQILLIRAGVETNPGPRTWYCSVCKRILEKNKISVRCNTCNGWSHLKPCSGLQSHNQWNANFSSQCCNSTNTNNINSSHTNTNQTQAHNPLVILQLNCNGLRFKIHEVIHFMTSNNISIAAIQETKLNQNVVNLSVPGYDIVRQDRSHNNGGGLAFIVQEDVQYYCCNLPNPPSTDVTIEQQGITVIMGTDRMCLVNLYIPPSSSCPPGYKANINHLLQLKQCLILGDVNAHHQAWYSSIPDDPRGIDILDQVDTSDFGILNENSPTRVTTSCSSSPDVSLASVEFLPTTQWSTMPALSSDHIPILITLQISTQVNKEKSRHQCYKNFAKADWDGFLKHVDEKIAKVPSPTNVHSGEKILQGILNKAARLFIPAGKHQEIRHNFPTSAARLADERDNLRKHDPQNPRIQQLSKEINHLVNKHIRQKWHKHLEKSSFKHGMTNLWLTIKKLSNPQKQSKSSVISFNDRPIPDNRKCATEFNRQYTPHPTEYDKHIRNTMRGFHSLSKEDRTRFTADNVHTVIKATNSSKALGPDNLSPIMLKHVGPKCVSYMTALFNLSMETLTIPEIWKESKVIPLLKPGKPADKSNSYRPISLLSPIAKIFEGLIFGVLKDHLNLEDHQHGFRKNRSTTTAVHHITDFIQGGLNEKRPNKRTILVALDLSRAFDTVSHSILLRDILESTLPSDIKRWLANYLRGRQTVVEFRGARSKHRKVKQGVPQGGVISPILFNFYLVKLPSPPEGIKLISYADDCSILAADPNITNICDKLNPYLDTLNTWFKERKLELSTEKSSATLFTTWTREANVSLDVKIGGRVIPTVKTPKILGVTLDNLLNFSEHVKVTRTKVQRRNNVLKALAGSTWGKEKETIVTSYKAICRSVVNYAAPIWTPQACDTNWKKLQSSQNGALRTATGCHRMTHQDHLHSETQVLPIKVHNELLSLQYLASCLLDHHTCHDITIAPRPPRSIRKTLSTTYLPVLHTHLNGEVPSDSNHKFLQRRIHTNIVNAAVEGYEPNRVLGTNIIPEVDESEKSLPRSVRTTLAQLRSGFCKLLGNYKARIGVDNTDLCPQCKVHVQDVHHLFSCPARPTTLDPTALWTHPVEAAAFLGLEDAEQP